MVPVLIVVCAILLVATVALWKGGIARTRRRSAHAVEGAKADLGRGDPIDHVAERLVREGKLPSLAAVRALADAAGMPPADALEVLRPYLTGKQLDVGDRMPTERFNASMDRFWGR